MKKPKVKEEKEDPRIAKLLRKEKEFDVTFTFRLHAVDPAHAMLKVWPKDIDPYYVEVEEIETVTTEKEIDD